MENFWKIKNQGYGVFQANVIKLLRTVAEHQQQKKYLFIFCLI